ncbi:MAG: hypothetical protein V4472_00775 [Pseudomonadota bacterium]
MQVGNKAQDARFGDGIRNADKRNHAAETPEAPLCKDGPANCPAFCPITTIGAFQEPLADLLTIAERLRHLPGSNQIQSAV